MADKDWAGISGSRASTEPASGLGPSGFDPGREEIVLWSLETVNEMANLGVIENTRETRARFLASLLHTLEVPGASGAHTPDPQGAGPGQLGSEL